jgi:hypothetical protein
MSAVVCQHHDGQGRQHRRLDDPEVAAAGGSLVEQIAVERLSTTPLSGNRNAAERSIQHGTRVRSLLRPPWQLRVSRRRTLVATALRRWPAVWQRVPGSAE